MPKFNYDRIDEDEDDESCEGQHINIEDDDEDSRGEKDEIIKIEDIAIK